MFEAGPINNAETFDPAISDFVEQYENLLGTLGKLESGQIEIINNKIVELDTKMRGTSNEEVRKRIEDCMERLAALVMSQMPERQNAQEQTQDHGIEVEELPVEDVEYKKAA